MPTPLSLRIAEIPGSSEKEGREGTIDIFELNWNILRGSHIDFDGSQRQAIHTAVRVFANIDKAMPALGKACADGRMLNEVIVEFYRIDPKTRSETKYYAHTLQTVQVTGVRIIVPNTLKLENESLRHGVVYDFNYDQIEFNYMPDSMVETISWKIEQKSGSASK